MENGQFVRGIPRRWTCGGLMMETETAHQSPKLNRKKIQMPLRNVKVLSKIAFKNMLRHAMLNDQLRSSVVESIVAQPIHRLSGLTRKETRQKIDDIVEHHLKDLPIRKNGCVFTVQDVLEQLRLRLKFKKQKSNYAISCHRAHADRNYLTVLVNCTDRLKMFTLMPSALTEIAVSLEDAEMMNLNCGLIIDQFVLELKPEYCSYSNCELENLINGLIVPKKPLDSSSKASLTIEVFKGGASSRRVELLDAALLVVIDHLLGYEPAPTDLSIVIREIAAAVDSGGDDPAFLESSTPPMESGKISGDETECAEDIKLEVGTSMSNTNSTSKTSPIILRPKDISVIREILSDHRMASYEGMLLATGEKIFIKGSFLLLNEMLNGGKSDWNEIPRALTKGDSMPDRVSGISVEDSVHHGGGELLHASSQFSPPVEAVLSEDGMKKHAEFVREVESMRLLPRHENVCRLIGFSRVDRREGMFLCYEYAEGGSLSSLIQDKSMTYDVLKIALDIARGMSFLHSHGIIHRDLKSANIVLKEGVAIASRTNQPSRFLSSLLVPATLWEGVAKVTDFGLSCLVREGYDMTAETGTYRWMAPEIIRHEPYSFPADVYSYGILLWELTARESPYVGLTPIQAAFSVAKHDLRPTIPSSVKPRLKALMNRCWHPVPSGRPSFSEIVELLGQISG